MPMFSIRTYGRTELAQLYCPTLVPINAWRRLQSWIALNRQLTRRLGALGYNGRQRTFTPAQVQAIVDLLGEP